MESHPSQKARRMGHPAENVWATRQTPAFQFGYDALSRRNSLTRPNGVNTTYAYDPASSLTSVLHKLGTTTLDGATYIYDAAENRKSRTDKRLNTTLNYTYDNIYQLLTAKPGAPPFVF